MWPESASGGVCWPCHEHIFQPLQQLVAIQLLLLLLLFALQLQLSCCGGFWYCDWDCVRYLACVLQDQQVLQWQQSW